MLAACGTPATTAKSPQSGAVRVVAIEAVYGDIARQMGGSAVAVTTILNSPGADPHTYEPTARDADAIAAADIVVVNGLGYDAFADKLIAASPRNGRTTLDAGTLGGHHLGDNPHVWYETSTLRKVNDAIAAEITRREAARAMAISTGRNRFDAWLDRVAKRMQVESRRYGGTPVAITEPVFDYALHAMALAVATPASFSHAIEEGNDPAPQDGAVMRSLLQGRHVAAFVYNRQTVEPATAQLLGVAKAAGVRVVPVTETLPPNTRVQAWIDGELDATLAALHDYRH